MLRSISSSCGDDETTTIKKKKKERISVGLWHLILMLLNMIAVYGLMVIIEDMEQIKANITSLREEEVSKKSHIQDKSKIKFKNPTKQALLLAGDLNSFHTFSQLFTKHYRDLFENQGFPDVFVGVSMNQVHEYMSYSSISKTDRELIEGAIRRIPNLKAVHVEKDQTSLPTLLFKLNEKRKAFERDMQNKDKNFGYELVTLLRAEVVMYKFPELINVITILKDPMDEFGKFNFYTTQLWYGRLHFTHNQNEGPYLIFGKTEYMDALFEALYSGQPNPYSMEKIKETLTLNRLDIGEDDRFEGTVLRQIHLRKRDYKIFQVMVSGEKQELPISSILFSLE